MTIEEKAELERRKSAAKSHCTETYETIQKLQSILSTYYKDYYRWRERFKKADRELAMVEKLHKLPGPGERKEGKKEVLLPATVNLSRKQVLEIAKVLGVEVELNFDEED